jgi:transposase
VPPEHLLRALLLQVLYSIRSERLLTEQLEYNLLFGWFVGLGMDDAPESQPTRLFGRGRIASAATRSMWRSHCSNSESRSGSIACGS